MQYTSNYNLKKPEGTDVVNIDDLNDNADILDQKLKEVENKADNAPPNSVNDAAIGSRTPDQSQAPASPGTGTLTQLISWLANRIKAITGKTNWWDAPPTTLQAAKTHMDAAAPHSGHETPAGAQAKAEAAAGAVQAELDAHLSEKVHQGEVHGLRTNDDKELEFFDGIEWKPSYFSYIPPDDISGAPGSKFLIGGDMQAGFFGEVSASELISGDALASLVGISQGTSQHSTAGWLKFAWQGKILFVAKKAFRNSISWDHINSANAVYGGKTVDIDGLTYKIRLMKGALTDPSEYEDPDRGAHGSEWNRLMLPIHEQAIDESWDYPEYVENDIPVWSHNLGSGNQGMYTDEDLLTHFEHGSGSRSWCQETRKDSATTRVFRGNIGVSHSGSVASSSTDGYGGWRPCLELVP